MIPQRKKREKYFPSEHGPSPPSAMQEMQETRVRSLGQENPPEEGMATHSSILAWEITWTEGPGKLQSMGPQRVRHDWSDLACTLTCQVWGWEEGVLSSHEQHPSGFAPSHGQLDGQVVYLCRWASEWPSLKQKWKTGWFQFPYCPCRSLGTLSGSEPRPRTLDRSSLWVSVS